MNTTIILNAKACVDTYFELQIALSHYAIFLAALHEESKGKAEVP